MVVSMKGTAVGIRNTMALIGAEALGVVVVEAPAATAQAVLHRRLIGLQGKGVILHLEMVQTLGKEQPLRTEATVGKVKEVRVVIGIIIETRVGRHTPRLRGSAIVNIAGAVVGKVEDEEKLPVGKVEKGEVQVGRKVSRGELSWTGRLTWRGQHSLLRGILIQMRDIFTPIRDSITQMRGSQIQMRSKIDQDSERNSFSVRAVPLLRFYCTMHVFHPIIIDLYHYTQSRKFNWEHDQNFSDCFMALLKLVSCDGVEVDMVLIIRCSQRFSLIVTTRSRPFLAF